MSYISSIDGSYYEGDKQYGDIDVPKRPSPNHIWQDEWVINPEVIIAESKLLGDSNYKATIRRRAKILQETSPYDAILLLKTIGE